MKSDRQLKKITRGALIATLYVILTMLSTVFGLSSGPIQIRLSEALIVLCCLYPEAIWGVTIGCFIANLLSGCIPLDLILGSAATLVGAFSAWLLARAADKAKLCGLAYLAPLPNVLANALIIPFLLCFYYSYGETYAYFFVTILISELLSSLVLGDLLLLTLRRQKTLFKNL